MTKLQTTVIGIALILFSVLYFGFSIKPRERAEIDKSRALKAESTDINSLVRAAKANISEDDLHSIGFLEQEVSQAASDSIKSEALKKLSGAWYKLDEYALAGVYAQKVAAIDNTEQTWSITGTTYALGVQKSTKERDKLFCRGRAVKAFEKAISFDPNNVQHQINLALCFVELPLQDNPMKGVLMLRDLVDKHPQNTAVLNNLARLAIKTGQYEKALERLGKSIKIEPDNPYTLSLLIEANVQSGKKEKAIEYQKKLEKIR